MSKELISKLRSFPMFFKNGVGWLPSTDREPICKEAADEIERLTDALEYVQAYLESALEDEEEYGLLMSARGLLSDVSRKLEPNLSPNPDESPATCRDVTGKT